MRPFLLQVEVAPEHSFAVREQVNPLFYNQWHYHAELELTYVEQGSGIRFVGDSIQNFQPGDLILIGSNLPHFWRSGNSGSTGECQATVVQFAAGFWGESFLNLPELGKIKDLFTRAGRGIYITGLTQEKVSSQLQALTQAKGVNRVVLLLQILELISVSNDMTYLCSAGYNISLNESDSHRLAKIYNYTLANFGNKIKLDEVAAVVHLSPNAFCRYFKTHTRKTYSRFLTEIRIGNACKLLMEDRLSVAQVCYESGFQNFSNFNRYFKAITKLTPQGYYQLHSKKI